MRDLCLRCSKTSTKILLGWQRCRAVVNSFTRQVHSVVRFKSGTIGQGPTLHRFTARRDTLSTIPRDTPEKGKTWDTWHCHRHPQPVDDRSPPTNHFHVTQEVPDVMTANTGETAETTTFCWEAWGRDHNTRREFSTVRSPSLLEFYLRKCAFEHYALSHHTY